MLLTITTTHQPATDLGYLLHKHPDRLQSFDLAFGNCYDNAVVESFFATLKTEEVEGLHYQTRQQARPASSATWRAFTTLNVGTHLWAT